MSVVKTQLKNQFSSFFFNDFMKKESFMSYNADNDMPSKQLYPFMQRIDDFKNNKINLEDVSREAELRFYLSKKVYFKTKPNDDKKDQYLVLNDYEYEYNSFEPLDIYYDQIRNSIYWLYFDANTDAYMLRLTRISSNYHVIFDKDFELIKTGNLNYYNWLYVEEPLKIEQKYQKSKAEHEENKLKALYSYIYYVKKNRRKVVKLKEYDYVEILRKSENIEKKKENRLLRNQREIENLKYYTGKIYVNGNMILTVLDKNTVYFYQLYDEYKTLLHDIKKSVRLINTGKKIERKNIESICFYDIKYFLISYDSLIHENVRVIENVDVTYPKDRKDVETYLKFKCGLFKESVKKKENDEDLVKDDDDSEEEDDESGWKSVELVTLKLGPISKIYVEPYEVNELPKFYIIVDKDNRNMLLRFDFEHRKNPNAINFEETDTQSIFQELVHNNIYHCEVAETLNRDMLVFVSYIYEEKERKFIKIKVTPVDRRNLIFLKKHHVETYRFIESTSPEGYLLLDYNWSFANNYCFFDLYYHGMTWTPEFVRKEDLVNTLVHPVLRVKSKEERVFAQFADTQGDVDFVIGTQGILYIYAANQLWIVQQDMYNNFHELMDYVFDNDILKIDVSLCGDRLLITFDNFICEVYLLNERGTLVTYYADEEEVYLPITTLILFQNAPEEDYNYQASFCKRDTFLTVTLDIAREVNTDYGDPGLEVNSESLVWIFKLNEWGKVLERLPFNYHPLDTYNLKFANVLYLSNKTWVRSHDKLINYVKFTQDLSFLEPDPSPILILQTDYTVALFKINTDGTMLNQLPFFYNEFKNEVLECQLHPFTNILAVLTEDSLHLYTLPDHFDNQLFQNKSKGLPEKEYSINAKNVISKIFEEECCSTWSQLMEYFKQETLFYNSANNKELKRYQAEPEFYRIDNKDCRYCTFNFSPNGKMLMIGDSNFITYVYPLKEDGRLLKEDNVLIIESLRKDDNSTRSVQFSLNMRYLIFAGGDGKLWSKYVSEERRVKVHTTEYKIAGNGRIESLNLNTDKKINVLCSDPKNKFIFISFDTDRFEQKVDPVIYSILEDGRSANPKPFVTVEEKQKDALGTLSMITKDHKFSIESRISGAIQSKLSSRRNSFSKPSMKTLDKDSMNNQSNNYDQFNDIAFEPVKIKKDKLDKKSNHRESISKINFKNKSLNIAVSYYNSIKLFSFPLLTRKFFGVNNSNYMTDKVSNDKNYKKINYTNDGRYIVAYYEYQNKNNKAGVDVFELLESGKFKNPVPVDTLELNSKTIVCGMLSDNQDMVLLVHELFIEIYRVNFEDEKKPENEEVKKEEESNDDEDNLVPKDFIHNKIKQEVFVKRNFFREKDIPLIKFKLDIKGQREYFISEALFTPDGRFLVVSCTYNYVIVYSLNELVPTLVETLIRPNKAIKSISVHQQRKGSMQYYLLIADESQVRVFYLDEGKNIYDDPVLLISVYARVNKAIFADNGRNIIVSFQLKDNKGLRTFVETYYAEYLLLVQASKYVMNELLDEYSSLKYNAYKILKLFISQDRFEVIKMLTKSNLTDFFYLGDSTSFNLALLLKNVSVVRVYLNNFILKRDFGSLNMVFDSILYIIEKNSGENKDEYIMRFLREFISLTPFEQIENLGGYVCDTVMHSFPTIEFDQNECWFNCPSVDIRSRKVKSASYYYPIIQMSRREILGMLGEEERAEVFSNEGIRTAINLVWEKIKYYVFYPYLFLYTCKFVCVIVLNISISLDVKSLESFFPYLLMLFSSLTLSYEITEFYKKQDEYLEDFWNYVELSSCTTEVLTAVLIILKIIFPSLREATGFMDFIKFIISVTLFFNLFVVLKLLRGFDDVSWLVRTILQNFMDIRNFLALSAILIFYFAIIFMTLYRNEYTFIENDTPIKMSEINVLWGQLAAASRIDNYSTVFKAILTTSRLIFGDFNFGYFDESINKYYAFFVYSLLQLVLVVVMLNTLIAILGESYSIVKANAENYAYKQKLDLINDYFDILPLTWQQDIQDTVGVIKLVAPVNSWVEEYDHSNDGAVEGQSKALRKDFIERVKINSKKTTETINARLGKLESRVGKFETTMNSISKTVIELKTEINKSIPKEAPAPLFSLAGLFKK